MSTIMHQWMSMYPHCAWGQLYPARSWTYVCYKQKSNGVSWTYPVFQTTKWLKAILQLCIPSCCAPLCCFLHVKECMWLVIQQKINKTFQFKEHCLYFTVDPLVKNHSVQSLQGILMILLVFCRIIIYWTNLWFAVVLSWFNTKNALS